MQRLREFVIRHINKSLFSFVMLVFRYKRKYKSISKTAIFAIKALPHLYSPNKRDITGLQNRKLFNKVDIKLDENDRFVYNIDIYKTRFRTNRGTRIIDNISIDYSKILETSLEDMKKINEEMSEGIYKQNQKELLQGIEEYIERECKAIEKSNRKDKEKTIQYLKNIENKKAITFEESIQRIMFYNQLLWQLGHNLNGLGRLDKILENSYEYDKKNNDLTKEKAKEILKDMIKILHKKYWFKSSGLIGDTGQIIILGGKEQNGDYFCNDLTYLFIEVLQELQLPDPKALLRVTENMPRDLMELALRCIQTGIGCPLFSNDDVIIPKLVEFGYDEKDAYNYVTSACWEPLMAGKSIDQNNISSIVFIKPLNQMLDTEQLETISSYNEFVEKYKLYLKQYIIEYMKDINKILWEESPLLSLLTDNCNKNTTDISQGGAKYNNYGLTTVSLGNTVNSIYNVKKLVFEEKKYTLSELNEMRKNNYEGQDELVRILKQQPERYGTQNEEIIQLANDITGYVDKLLDGIPNRLGGKMKFGLSAPTYIMESGAVPASFDGRKNGEAFIVHISSDKTAVAYTELIQFASKLKYDNHRFNGNVIDFMITPSFIEDNFDKMIDFLMISIKLGFFQMQMNVTSSEILIKAKANPKEYENLIVRVWGFSAYFNDLPENYKDLLIERALKNEGKI